MSKVFGLLLYGSVIVYLLKVTVSPKILPQYDTAYSNCIQKVFENQFVGTSVSIVLPKFTAKVSDAFVKSLHGHYTVTVVDKNKKTIASSSYKATNNLIIISSRLDLINSIKYLKMSGIWNPLARTVVILRNEMVNAKRMSLLNMSEIKKIFAVFMKERSIEVNLITFDEDNVPKIFAWFPFDDESNCSQRVQIVQLVGECISDGMAKNDIFMIGTNRTGLPIVPRTFNKCPLTIAAFDIKPYTICNHQSTCDNGIEIRLFESVAESLKLNLEVNVERKVDETMYRRLVRR